MIFDIFCLKDARVGWLNPTFEQNENVAYRNFAHAVQNSDSILHSHAKDFSLYKIGTFDSDSGLINSCIPEFIVGGDDLVIS